MAEWPHIAVRCREVRRSAGLVRAIPAASSRYCVSLGDFAMRKELASDSETVVFFDGSCPLCRAEMNYFRSRDSAGALRLVDVAAPGAPLPYCLDRDKAMVRFHVLSRDEVLLSGPAAFAEVWKQIPGWNWAGRLATQPFASRMLEVGYSLFLVLRPALQRLFLCAQWIVSASRRRGR